MRMILLHRITPFALLIVSAAGFWAAMQPWGLFPLWPLFVSLVLCFFLFARLGGWASHRASSWHLILPSLLFLASVQGLFLLAETVAGRVALAMLASLTLFFYAEQVFTYVHAPALYQPFAIQHVSLGMNLVTVFCAGAVAFGTRVFLQAPFAVLVPAVAVVAGYGVFQALWASKMEGRRAAVFGVAAGVAAGESVWALALLPTGFYVDAAVLTLVLYVFLGLSRASFLKQLTRPLAVRYVAAGVVLASVLLGTAAWQ